MKNSEGISSMVVEVTEEIMSGSTVINRIPATASSRKHNHNKASRNNAVKRRGSFGSKQSRGSSDDSYDRSASSSSSSHQRGGRSSSHVARPSPKRLCQPMDLEEEFDRLDPKQEDHARRIFQRRKALQKGKNTPGYHNYVAQVPKHQRIARSMKTPSTPDPTIKISTKRWQGLVKAWYGTWLLARLAAVLLVTADTKVTVACVRFKGGHFHSHTRLSVFNPVLCFGFCLLVARPFCQAHRASRLRPA